MESVQCRATSKRSGKRCRHRVIGTTICHMHGQNSRTKTAMARRIALAEALAADPRRHPGEVLLDVLHSSDHLMRRAREEITADSLTVETMAKLVELTETAGRWAKMTLDVGVQERAVKLAEAQGNLVADAVGHILDDLRLNPAQRALVPTVVPRHLRAIGGRS